MSDVLFNRRFQFWKYDVSHSQALFRAPKEEAARTRVDLLFTDVRMLNIPSVMHIERISRNGERAFEIAHSEGSAAIDAGTAVWCEDEGEYFDPSPIFGGRIDPRVTVHEILERAH